MYWLNGMPKQQKDALMHQKSEKAEKDETMLFDEKNKPLSFVKNQDHVARKITEFRDSIIERFGSSQVPTPAVKDVYKQCAGGLSSEVKVVDHNESKDTYFQATQQPTLIDNKIEH